MIENTCRHGFTFRIFPLSVRLCPFLRKPTYELLGRTKNYITLLVYSNKLCTTNVQFLVFFRRFFPSPLLILSDLTLYAVGCNAITPSREAAALVAAEGRAVISAFSAVRNKRCTSSIMVSIFGKGKKFSYLVSFGTVYAFVLLRAGFVRRISWEYLYDVLISFHFTMAFGFVKMRQNSFVLRPLDFAWGRGA